MGEARLLIGGKLVDATGGGTFDNINPATEEVLGVVADGTAADMQAAVAAARTAFDTTDWSTNRELRKRCLLQLQAAIESEQEELRAELVAEVGCPVLLTYGPQLDAPLREALTWPAEMIDEFEWSRSLGPKDAFGMGSLTEREVWKEPIGVVGVIVPWNFPIEIILNKLGPVLAMGNTCVLKPAPDTPWNATRLGRLIVEKTDIPPGVVNIVVGQDHLIGEVLTTSPDVDMIAFTGSTATGRRIMAAASETLKPVFLELGGKSVNLVLDDADLTTALASASRRLLPRRPGVCHPHPLAGAELALRRGGRHRGRRVRQRHLRRSHRPREPPGPAGARSASRTGCSATSRRARPRAPASSPAAGSRRSSTRASTSSPRSSPTSTTP